MAARGEGPQRQPAPPASQGPDDEDNDTFNSDPAAVKEEERGDELEVDRQADGKPDDRDDLEREEAERGEFDASLPDTTADEAGQSEGPLSLADELGVHELGEIVFIDNGRLFSAAGRSAPIVELTEDENLLMRPAEKPLSDEIGTESIEIRIDDRGILLNELGERRKFAGVKFKGRSLFYMGETVPDTFKHYVGFFDPTGNLCKLYLQGRPVTSEIIYKLRVRTHDGEIGVFPELSDDPHAHERPPADI